MGNLYSIDWFSDQGGGVYSQAFGGLKKLEHDSVNAVFRLQDPDGTVTLFNDMTHPSRPGLFKSITTPGGNTTAVVQESGGSILEVQRSYTSGSDTITESFFYEFFTTGDNVDHLQRCTLRRKTNNGAWENVLKSEYTYYGSSDANGSLNDLRTVTRFEWDGSAWQQLGINYYRYWKAGAAKGFEHGIKYVVNPKAYQKMLDDGHDPLAASDSILAQYADYYYEYDVYRRAVKEMVDGASRSYSFSFVRNPRYVNGQPRDFNFWLTKTTETLPGGTQIIMFTNDTGQGMLRIVKSGNDEWYEFTRFDSVGRVILTASSEAISGYNENLNDLLGYDPVTGKFQFLNDNDGLIQLREYYASTGGGGAAGYLKSEKIKKGQLGTEIPLRSYEYTSHSAGSDTIYPVSKEIVYPDDTDPNKKIETTFAYTFYPNKTQIEKKTTTLPVISSAQNGSGTANSFEEVFDEYGNKIWHKDERGFITRFKYNIETGAMVQQIDDVDTAQVSDEPAGWATPTGGGLHLITDYTHDSLGRVTETLGPAHTVDLGGVATEIRRADWTVYKDYQNKTISASGYQKTSDQSYTLVNPVSISITDKHGNPTEQIQATRGSGTTSPGKLLPTDSFAQSSYVRWTTHQYTECCKLISTRVYHTIPATGEGTSGTNYDQTDFGYDVRNRQNRVKTPGGTITYTVFDARSLPTKIFVGTNDTGATQNDPTGGGAAGNNMVLVTENEYDGGVAGKNGNLTKVTQYVDSSTTRATNFTYDFRNRQITTDGEIDLYEKVYYDNLDRVYKTERYDTSDTGNLIAREETRYDDLGRVYQTVRYAVDPTTGAVGNSLTDNTWYDAAGNVMKQLPAGADLFVKTTYDGLGRETTSYTGFDIDETTYADAGTITGDTILLQSETSYDAAGNVIQSTVYERYHNATGTGALNGPGGTEPKARVSYVANWHDGLGRVVATADYGTNGGTALSRPALIPASSDTVLVSTTAFAATGDVATTTDPAGMVTKYEFDDAGRQTKLIENYQSSSSSSSSSAGTGCPNSDDVNRTTVTTYTPDGDVATLVAWNATTGNQTTTYTYGTTLADSDIATSNLLRQVAYPDSVGGSDVVKIAYNRQGERKSVTDQNGTVHQYDFDLLGRMIHDRTTTLGTGVDASVQRISFTYEVRGMIDRITSYDNPAVGMGNVVNEVSLSYNNFGQLITDQQSHSGAVGGTTPKVQYAYADGSAGTVRATGLTYPNGRNLSFDYGVSGSIDDAAGRIAGIKDGATTLAGYSYLGLGTPIEVDYTEPDVKYTLIGTAGGNDPDTGDIYRGLDRFGRVKDSYWYDYGASQDVDRIKYGYDRASNRIWRENTVAAAASKDFDELYDYDLLHRLKDMARGRLDTAHTGLSAKTFAQCWTLDETGNWKRFQEDDTGAGTWSLVQNRTANPVNEITDITESTGPAWGTPAYDPAGNMTTIPKPADPTQGFAAVYDAWNRLVKLSDSSGTVQENQYDGRNFRVVRKDYSSGLLTETRHFYYTSAWQVLEERVDSSTNPNRQFVWGLRYIDDCVLRDRDTSSDGMLDERLYALQDGNWNVTSVTDENGDVQERYAYTAYGEPVFLSPSFVEQSGSSFGWEVLFTGQRWDAERYHLFRRRVYLWNVGCFAARDPAGYGSGDVNIYAYVSNDPLILTDPSGRFLFCATLAAIGTYLAWKAAESVAETTIEYGIAKTTGDKSFSYTRSFGRNMVVNSTVGAIPGATEAKMATKVAIYTGKLALRTTLDAAYETYVPGGENRSFKENFVRAGVGNVGGDLAGAAMRRTGSFVLKKVPCGKSGMSCYEKISEALTRKPNVLYHYMPSSTSGKPMGTGRLWATPYSSAPDGWAYKPGVISGSLRVLRTGRWKPFDPSRTKVITGAALDEFQLVRFHGPFRTLKALGGQHVTIRPGTFDFGAGRLMPPTPQQLATYRLRQFGANVLDPAAVVGGTFLYYSIEALAGDSQ